MIYTAPDLLRRQWTTEVDTVARQVRISRQWLGMRPKIVVDCSFDECDVLGVMEYNVEEHLAYGVYLQLKNGKRHAIPLTSNSLDRVSSVATEVSRAIGIQRRDTSYR